MLTINERVFRLLYDSHRTQKELADFCGINERNIGSWKTRGSDPPAKLICKIAEFFGVSVVWLLSGEEQDPPSFVNNGSVAGNIGANSGTIYVVNGGERVLSDECVELVRVYESLGVRDRVRLLDTAFQIADGRFLDKFSNVKGGDG